MSFNRTILAACTAVFAIVFAPAAFAGCGGCGFAAPAIEYAPAPVYAAPIAYGGGGCCGGCGGCGSAVAVTYVQPVVYVQPAPVMVAPQPIAVDHWDTGGWGRCGGCGGGGFGYTLAPSAAYVVNQGPYYSGPGTMIPYQTYSPGYGLANPAAYPYIGAGYYGPRYARPYYGAHAAYRPYRHYYRRTNYWRG
jgi:hypothetical protein